MVCGGAAAAALNSWLWSLKCVCGLILLLVQGLSDPYLAGETCSATTQPVLIWLQGLL